MIGALIFMAVVGAIVLVWGVVCFDIPERKYWEERAKQPHQYRLPGF